MAGFKASQSFLSGNTNPPVITGIFVSSLYHPDYLVEIEATAYVGI